MKEISAKKFLVSGLVQGVFLRDFSSRKARELILIGYAKNLFDGSVEIVAQGEKEQVEKFIEWLKTEGSPLAKIKSIKIKDCEINPAFKDFEII